MHLVFRALTGKIEQEVGDNFGVCFLNLPAGLRKNRYCNWVIGFEDIGQWVEDTP